MSKLWAIFLCLFPLAVKAGEINKVQATILTVAEASLLVDMMQTWNIPRRHNGRYEINPILGRYPSDGAVFGYFATWMVATAVATYFLPENCKVFPSMGVLFIEIPQVGRNLQVGAKLSLPW